MADMSPLHRKVFVYDNTPLCKVEFENIMNFRELSEPVSLLHIISSIFMLYYKDERNPMNSILFSWKSFLV